MNRSLQSARAKALTRRIQRGASAALEKVRGETADLLPLADLPEILPG